MADALMRTLMYTRICIQCIGLESGSPPLPLFFSAAAAGIN